MTFWRDYDQSPQWEPQQLVELPEPANADEAIGRAMGLETYTSSMLATLDKPRHGSQPAILREWEEYLKAARYSLEETAQQNHGHSEEQELKCALARVAESEAKLTEAYRSYAGIETREGDDA